MRSLSETLQTTFKCKLQESVMEQQSIQKVLRLFGYPNATQQRYICCLTTEPRLDVHRYVIGSRMFVMCMITKDQKVVDSALWSISEQVFNNLTNKTLTGCKTIEDIDMVLQTLSSGHHTFVMRYCPS